MATLRTHRNVSHENTGADADVLCGDFMSDCGGREHCRESADDVPDQCKGVELQRVRRIGIETELVIAISKEFSHLQ